MDILDHYLNGWHLLKDNKVNRGCKVQLEQQAQLALRVNKALKDCKAYKVLKAHKDKKVKKVKTARTVNQPMKLLFKMDSLAQFKNGCKV